MQLSLVLFFASSASFINSVVAALPLFIRGRPVGGFVGAPRVSVDRDVDRPRFVFRNF